MMRIMTPTTEEERNDDNCDRALTTVEYKGHLDNENLKRELAMGIKTESTMGKTVNGKKAVCVDDIINGVKSCQIGDDSMTAQLNTLFGNLMLENNNEEELLKPEEDGETREDQPEITRDEDVVDKKSVEEIQVPCSLVALEAPSFDDDEEVEGNEQLSEMEAENTLKERGPINGVPSSFMTQSGHAGSYGYTSMPPDLDKPRKYFRPQEVGIEEMPTPTALGNAFNAGVRGLKTISQSLISDQKLMSGGTVYASDNILSSSDKIFSGIFDSQDLHIAPEFLELDLEVNFDILQDMDCFHQELDNILGPGTEGQVFQAPNAGMSNQQGYNQHLWHLSNLHNHQQIVQGVKRGSSGETSEGYASDFSPLHEMHSSPIQSPHSSPAVLNMSPPQNNWSPPPSNISQSSIDSGVCSPLADDQVYLSQVCFTDQDFPSSCCISDQSAPDNHVSSYIDEHEELYRDVIEVINQDLRDTFKVTQPAYSIAASKSAIERTTGVKNNSGIKSKKLQMTEPRVNVSKQQDGSTKRKSIGKQQLNGLTVNHEGKVAIPPTPQKKPVLNPGQMVSVLMSPDGILPPIFVVQKKESPKTLSKTLRPIFPKDPNKQVQKVADAHGKPTNTSPQTQNYNASKEGKLSQILPTNGEKTVERVYEMKQLNLARRVVAQIPASDLVYRDEDGDTCIHVAVCMGDKFLLQALLERLMRENLQKMINVQNLQGQTSLYLAVSTNNAEMVQLLVERGADVSPCAESVTSSGICEKLGAIHCTCSKGENYLNTLKALLKAPGINLNQVNSNGHSALHCAILAHGKMSMDGIQFNSIPIIQALIQAGVDPNLQVRQSGKTAFMYALESRDLDLIESTFRLVEPSKLAAVLKAQAYDGSSCSKIADSLKPTLSQSGRQRLSSCLKPRINRGALVSSS